MRVLICPDKFKGTLDARAAARAMAAGWRRVRPKDHLELLPISDGGDGFGSLIGRALAARAIRTRTIDAAQRPCISNWWWAKQDQGAIIESALTIGLAMLPPGNYHPFDLDTRGLGRVLAAATSKGAKECLVGIGGSATNDGGFGLGLALGWRFLSRKGELITQWTDLDQLQEICPPPRPLQPKVTVAVDVRNPLLGPSGATRIYGPQKGLRPQDFPKAEKCLGRLAAVVRKHFGRDIASIPGAGAAGGLGFGLIAFAGAALAPGFDLFAREVRLDQALAKSDVVLTGEGRIDRSTVMGKGVGQVGQRCTRKRIPCIAIAGSVDLPINQKLFGSVRALTELTTTDEAKAHPRYWLNELASLAAKDFSGTRVHGLLTDVTVRLAWTCSSPAGRQRSSP